VSAWRTLEIARNPYTTSGGCWLINLRIGKNATLTCDFVMLRCFQAGRLAVTLLAESVVPAVKAAIRGQQGGPPSKWRSSRSDKAPPAEPHAVDAISDAVLVP
jgi:hypothetical protein